MTGPTHSSDTGNEHPRPTASPAAVGAMKCKGLVGQDDRQLRSRAKLANNALVVSGAQVDRDRVCGRTAGVPYDEAYASKRKIVPRSPHLPADSLLAALPFSATQPLSVIEDCRSVPQGPRDRYGARPGVLGVAARPNEHQGATALCFSPCRRYTAVRAPARDTVRVNRRFSAHIHVSRAGQAGARAAHRTR